MDAVDSPSSSCVIVPRGWSREVTEEKVYYVSPVGNVLSTRDELFIYLMTDGTCKCGLRCPFQVDIQFSFDPSVISLPDHGDPDSLCKRANVDCCSSSDTPTEDTPPPYMAPASDCYLRTRNGSDMISKRSPTPQELKKHKYRQYSLTRFSPNGTDDALLKNPRKGVNSPERGHLRSRRSLSADFEKPLTESAALKPYSNYENMPSIALSNSPDNSDLANLPVSSLRSRFSTAPPSLAIPAPPSLDLPSAKSLSHQLNSITKSHLELITLLQSVSNQFAQPKSSGVAEPPSKPLPKLQPKPSTDERGVIEEFISGGYRMSRKPRKAKMEAAARLLSLTNSPPRESGRDRDVRAPLKPSQLPTSVRDTSPQPREVSKSAKVNPALLPANLNGSKSRNAPASAWKEPERREMAKSESNPEVNPALLPANLDASKSKSVPFLAPELREMSGSVVDPLVMSANPSAPKTKCVPASAWKAPERQMSKSASDSALLPASKSKGELASAWKEPQLRATSRSTSMSEVDPLVISANPSASKTRGVSASAWKEPAAPSLPRTAAPSSKMETANSAAPGGLKPLPGNFSMLRVPSLSLPKTCVVPSSSRYSSPRAASLPVDKMEEAPMKGRELEFPGSSADFSSLRAVSVPPEDPCARTEGRSRALSCSSSPTGNSGSKSLRRRPSSVTPDGSPLPYKSPLPGKLRDVQLRDFHISLTNCTPRKKLESSGNSNGSTRSIMDSKPKQRRPISKRQLKWSKRLRRHTADNVGLKKIKNQAEMEKGRNSERPDALAMEVGSSSDALPVDSAASPEAGHVTDVEGHVTDAAGDSGMVAPAGHVTSDGGVKTVAGHVTDSAGHVTSDGGMMPVAGCVITGGSDISTKPADRAASYDLRSSAGHVMDISGHVTSHMTAPSSNLTDGTTCDFSMDTTTSQTFEDLDMKFFAALPNMTFDFTALDPDLPNQQIVQSQAPNTSSLEVEKEVVSGASSWGTSGLLVPASGNATVELHSTPQSGPTVVSAEVTPGLEPENKPTDAPEHQVSELLRAEGISVSEHERDHQVPKLLGTEGILKSKQEEETLPELSTRPKCDEGVVSLPGLIANPVSLSAPAGREGLIDSNLRSPTTGIFPPPPPSHDITHSNSASSSSYLTPPSNFGGSVLTTPSPPVDSSVSATPQDADSAIILPLTPLSAGSTDLAPPTVGPCLTHPTSTSTLTPSGPCVTPPTFSCGQQPSLTSQPSLTLPTADQTLTPSAEDLPLTPPSADFSVTSRGEDMFSSAGTISTKDKSCLEAQAQKKNDYDSGDFGKDLNGTISKDDDCLETLKKQDDGSGDFGEGTISKEDRSYPEAPKKQDDGREGVFGQAEDFGDGSNVVGDMEWESDGLGINAVVDMDLDSDDQYVDETKDKNLVSDVVKDQDLDPSRNVMEDEDLDLHGDGDMVKNSNNDRSLDPNVNMEEKVVGEVNSSQDDTNVNLSSPRKHAYTGKVDMDSDHLGKCTTATSNSADKFLDSQKAASANLLPLETFLSCEVAVFPARERVSASPSLSSVHQLDTKYAIQLQGPMLQEDAKESHDKSHETTKESVQESHDAAVESHEMVNKPHEVTMESRKDVKESHVAAEESHETVKESHEVTKESPEAMTGTGASKTGKRGRPKKKARKPPSKKTKKKVADATTATGRRGRPKKVTQSSNEATSIDTELAEEGSMASERSQPVLDTETSPDEEMPQDLASLEESSSSTIESVKDENSAKSQAGAVSESTAESQRQCNLRETGKSMDEDVSTAVDSHGVKLQDLTATKADTATSVSTPNGKVSDEGSREESEVPKDSNIHSADGLQEADISRKRDAQNSFCADLSVPSAKRMKLVGDADAEVAAESCDRSNGATPLGDVAAEGCNEIDVAEMEESSCELSAEQDVRRKDEGVAEIDSDVAPEIVATSRTEETADGVTLNVAGEGAGVLSDVAATVSAAVRAVVSAVAETTSSIAGSCTSNVATKSCVTETDCNPVTESTVNDSLNPLPKASSEERKVRRKRFDFVYKAYPIRSRGGSSVSTTPPNSHSPSPSFVTPSEASSSFKLPTPKTSTKPKSPFISKSNSVPKGPRQGSKGKQVSPKSQARKKLVENSTFSVKSRRSGEDFSAVVEEFLGVEKSPESELTVSIPLRMGKKIVAHHTLLPCMVETAAPTTPPTSHFPIKLGDLVWAKANQMPGWPAWIVSHKKKKMPEPPADKVWVEWIGEKSVSLVNKNNIRSLKEGMSKRLKQSKPLSKDLKTAIEEAIAAATKHLNVQ